MHAVCLQHRLHAVAGGYGMYLATQNGLVSSATSTAAVTQYDNTVTEGPALPPDLASWGSPMQGTTSRALSPEPGQQSGLHLTCNDVDNILRRGGEVKARGGVSIHV